MKRKRIKRAKKILSCNGNKIIFYALMIVCIVALVSCASSRDAAWEAYCRLYNVNPEHPTEEQETYYMDVWLETDEACEYME